jgi:tetratricopeptide (TPR) repeat protein
MGETRLGAHVTRWETDEERVARDEQWSAALAEDPALGETFAEVSKAVAGGTVTLAQVGGFTQDELDSAYGAASTLVNVGKLNDALQITGYLILLEPWKARYYVLAGVCFHRRQQYDMALQYFDVAFAIDADPVTQMRKGETLLMLGEREQAGACLQAAIDSAPANDPALEPHIERATQLLATYLPGGDR